MNDYLWDKKGEPDADEARLEALLGAFAHEPRPLEWPAAAAAPESPKARLLPFAPRVRASRFFAPAALAAAAGLLVASVLAASAFLRARSVGEGVHVVAMLEPPPDAFGVKDKTPPAVVKVIDEKVAVESLTRVTRRRKDAQVKDVQLAAVSKRRQRDLNAEAVTGASGPGLTLEALSTRGGTSSLVESARLLTKEQLVYALRFTGAKLKDVREKARETQKDER
jgi:hypothetical protein